MESATLASGLAPQRSVNANSTPVENLDPALGGPVPTIDYWNFVEPGYFRTAGIHLVEGRLFNASDALGAAPVAIINQTMARAFWKNESPIGHRVKGDFRPRGGISTTIEARWPRPQA